MTPTPITLVQRLRDALAPYGRNWGDVGKAVAEADAWLAAQRGAEREAAQHAADRRAQEGPGVYGASYVVSGRATPPASDTRNAEHPCSCGIVITGGMCEKCGGRIPMVPDTRNAEGAMELGRARVEESETTPGRYRWVCHFDGDKDADPMEWGCPLELQPGPDAGWPAGSTLHAEVPCINLRWRREI